MGGGGKCLKPYLEFSYGTKSFVNYIPEIITNVSKGILKLYQMILKIRAQYCFEHVNCNVNNLSMGSTKYLFIITLLNRKFRHWKAMKMRSEIIRKFGKWDLNLNQNVDKWYFTS